MIQKVILPVGLLHLVELWSLFKGHCSWHSKMVSGLQHFLAHSTFTVTLSGLFLHSTWLKQTDTASSNIFQSSKRFMVIPLGFYILAEERW